MSGKRKLRRRNEVEFLYSKPWKDQQEHTRWIASSIRPSRTPSSGNALTRLGRCFTQLEATRCYLGLFPANSAQHQNANVFYELAIRHAIRRPLVQITDKGEDIPFDLRTMRTIQVEHQKPDIVEEAKTEIRKQIGDSALRMVAERKQIEVHGVLWVTDELESHGIVPPRKLYDVRRLLHDAPLVFLPDNEVQHRIRPLARLFLGKFTISRSQRSGYTCA